MRSVVFLLTLGFTLTLTSATQFTTCENGIPPATSLDIPNCDNLPCNHPNAESFPISLGFTLNRDVGKIELFHEGWWLDTTVNWTMIENVCEDIEPVNAECPPSGTQLNITSSLQYSRSFYITVEVSVRDENFEGLACARFWLRTGSAALTTPVPSSTFKHA